MTITALINPFAPFRIALRARNLRLLLTGLATSQAGDWLYNLALLAFVYDRTHSSMWVGLTTAARIVPEVALGSLGGVLADRVDRRTLMLGSDALRALAMAALVIIGVAHLPVVLAAVVAALSTAAGSAYPTCVVAVLPELATAEELPAANAARVSITYICVVAGPLFGVILLLLGSPTVAFAVNAGTFVLGGLAVAALPRQALRVPAGTEADPYRGFVSELRTGWLALRGYPDARPVVIANVIASAVYGALTVLLVLVGQRLGLGVTGFGYLLAGAGAGGVLATGLAHRASSSPRTRLMLAGALLAVGAPLPILALAGSLPAAIALAAVCGAGSVIAEVVGDTALQRALDPSVFARAYGLVIPACVAAIAVGALLAPISISILGVPGTLVAIGIGVLSYAALLVASPERRRPATETVAAALS
ncbi:MAG TPA: MFS transporter [Solirubrobacteraceae bacterium]|jgi:predicted MFS family arabinose efflux permease|nr:MFS transporter [Solirubrobacteraceae bacterium]